MSKNKIENFFNQIFNEYVLDFLDKLPENSIDLVLTDPPYFLDKLDHKWNANKINEEKEYCKVVTSLPPGMKFGKEQGKQFYDWYLLVSQKIYRVLKPGGFFFSFSSPRLFHRMTCAMDDAGFLIRDMLMWMYTQSQPKAMGLNHFIEKKNLSEKEKEKLLTEMNGWKTPQIKTSFEPIAMAQKPTEGTFLENFQKYKVGLINTNIKVGVYKDKFPANTITTEFLGNVMDRYFLIEKPDKKEKGTYNTHKTVKPISLCEHLILLTTYDNNAIILDPFSGSGTTLVAAKKCNRFFIGNDINAEYIQIAFKRLADINKNSNQPNLFSQSKEQKMS